MINRLLLVHVGCIAGRMEEGTEHARKTFVAVINKGIKDAGFLAQRDDIVVGDGGGDEGAVAFL